MPGWAKNLVLIVGLSGWLAVVIAPLLKDQIPDAPMMGIPAALWIALAPPFKIGRRGNEEGNADAGADEEAADGTP